MVETLVLFIRSEDTTQSETGQKLRINCERRLAQLFADDPLRPPLDTRLADAERWQARPTEDWLFSFYGPRRQVRGCGQPTPADRAAWRVTSTSSQRSPTMHTQPESRGDGDQEGNVAGMSRVATTSAPVLRTLTRMTSPILTGATVVTCRNTRHTART